MSHTLKNDLILDGQSCRRTERRVQLSSFSRFLGMMSHIKQSSMVTSIVSVTLGHQVLVALKLLMTTLFGDIDDFESDKKKQFRNQLQT